MLTPSIVVTNFVTVIITNAQPSSGGTDVVNSVNGFYSSAFTHTCWLLGILLTILGFAIPAAYFVLAKIQLKLREQKLIEQLKREIEETGKKLQTENSNNFDALEKKLKTEIRHAKAGVCLVQGHFFMESGHKKPAIESYIATIKNFALTPDFKQLQGTLECLAGALKTCNREDITSEAAEAFPKIIESVGKIEVNGLLDTEVKNLKKEFKEAQERKPK